MRQTSTANVVLGEDGIIRASVRPGAEDTLASARENIAACAELAQGRRLPVLVDFREVRAQDRGRARTTPARRRRGSFRRPHW